MAVRGAVLFGWLAAIALSVGNNVQAEITLLGVARIDGTAEDRSGHKGAFNEGTPKNRLGGLGSAIAFTDFGEEYLLAADRGPADGAVDYPCRIHRMRISIRPDAETKVEAELLSTTLLTNELNVPLIGAFKAAERFDPEGIAIDSNDNVYIADEYGPSVCLFSMQGRMKRRLTLPQKFICQTPGSPKKESSLQNTSGRQPNRGMEGLALEMGGKHLIGAMQSPLIQDNALSSEGKRIGVNCRLLQIQLSNGKTKEFVYPLDKPAFGVSEVLSLGEGKLLVLERDGKAGTEAKFKRLYLVDVRDASDVSSIEKLPPAELPTEIKPASKKLFLDLLDPKHKIVGATCPEKFEGLTLGPKLADGRKSLIVTVDNDFFAEVPLSIYVFAVDRIELP